MLAFTIRGLACNTHENCDGSCLNVISYKDPPLIDQSSLLMSMLMAVVMPKTTRATAQDALRDAHWVARQEFPVLDYSAINSPCRGISSLEGEGESLSRGCCRA